MPASGAFRRPALRRPCWGFSKKNRDRAVRRVNKRESKYNQAAGYHRARAQPYGAASALSFTDLLPWMECDADGVFLLEDGVSRSVMYELDPEIPARPPVKPT